MAAADDIKSNLDLDQIAQYLGTDRETADAAVNDALNQLVGAMDTNVAQPDGALSLGRALGDHVSSPAYGQNVDINAVDTADGEKIVRHVFSDNEIQTLGSTQGGGLLQKLLPILAPIVMGYLASKLQERLGGAVSGGRAQAPAQQPGQGGFGDILGDLLGGGAGQAQQPPQTRQAPTQPSGGGFSTPGVQPTDLQVPGGTTQQPTGAPRQAPGGGGDLLGSILSDLLRGGRR